MSVDAAPPAVCFLDTETTSLAHDRRAWDIAAIRREPDGTETITNVIVADVDLAHADPASLSVGRFYDRHPRYGGDPGGAEVLSEHQAAHAVEKALHQAHIVGAVPDFDVHVLKELLWYHGLPWTAHHHLVDFECLCVGWLAAHGEAPELPWHSADLSRAVEVDPPEGSARHTALGDALWARAVFDRIVNSEVDMSTTAGVAVSAG